MRQSGTFLGSALSSPQARYILFHDLKPLVIDQPSETVDGFPVSNKLSSLPWQEVALMLSPTGSAIVDPGEVVDPTGTMWPKQLASHSANARQPVLDQCLIIIFLGTDNSTEHPDVDKSLQAGHGSPVWAIDVTPIYERTSKTLLQRGQFLDMKKANLAPKEANLAAQARALIDWNLRNKFCAACGRPTYSALAGWKLACTSNLEKNGDVDGSDPATTSPRCVTNSFSIQNFW
jgi:NAD+ diphosphatase